MARLKAKEKLIVVKHQPGLSRKRRLVWLTSVLVAASLGYVGGSAIHKHNLDKSVASLTSLSSEHQNLQAEMLSLRQKVVNLESGKAIDDQAKQQIQETISTLKSDLSASQKDLAFYRNIMAPSDNARGLQVQSAELKGLSDARRYAYKIVLAQVADNKSYVSGVVAINLIGMLEGNQEVVPLRDITELTDLGVKFRFRYFQNIAGELTLPEGFAPERIQVVAQSKGKKASRIEQSFEWKQMLEGS